MYEEVILIRYGELYLKGKNRDYFENRLKDEIRRKLKPFGCDIFFGRGRYVVEGYKPKDRNAVLAALQTVFGVHSVSVAKKTEFDVAKIAECALENCPKSGTFRVSAKRCQKNYPLTSMELNCQVGEAILNARPKLSVNLNNPDCTVNIDVRENGKVYVYFDAVRCAGGMPSGTAGKGLLLLSGGIDSPVAGYMMAKRGLSLVALHFHSYPYTSQSAKDKAIKLAKRLKVYDDNVKLIAVSLTEIQEAIHEHCRPHYMITLVRRFMMRIANRIAAENGCTCIVNGESLGQVASQTVESITVTGAMASLPVFRPLIGMDKDEIISIAEKIETFDISAEPYEDCCTVFLPDHPVIKPTLEKAEAEEARLEVDNLVESALKTMEVLEV